MKFFAFLAVLTIPLLTLGAPAVLFEEVEVQEVSEASQALRKGSSVQREGPETRIQPLSQRSTLREIYQNQEFNSVFEMKAKRRVGVGAVTSGATGLLGVMLELNFTPSSSVVTAFGGGPGYNAFNFQWKNLLGGRNFAPYIGIGYARWYNSSNGADNIGRTTPAILGSRFLSEDQKRTGEFAIDLITPNIGIQYNQLFGPYTGTALFAELTFLTEIEDFSLAPTGALGAIYYF